MNVLLTQCGVSEAFDPDLDGIQPQHEDFVALWDTGATGSVITQQVVDKCGLSPTGMANVNTANGLYVAETYLVNLYLPNNVMFIGLRVTKAELAGTDVLVGMDVMNQGDLAVTHSGGRTAFSFSMPSKRSIDFVKEDNEREARARGMTRKDRRKADRQARRGSR